MKDDDVKLPAPRPGAGLPAIQKKVGILAAIRAGKAAVQAPAAGQLGRATLLAAAAATRRRPRMVLAIDATASREAAWDAARQTTDSLFQAFPGQLDVALAVHGGDHLHTFTGFFPDASTLRDTAASIRCQAGRTRMVDILERTRESADVRVCLYVGDVFEESPDAAYAAADALRLRGCRVIVLQDGDDRRAAEVFGEIARRTGGALIPFDAEAVWKLRELLEAISTLAVGGTRLLEARRKTLPGATLLLGYLKGD